MSLILDALRKLDRERTAGGSGKRNISAEMLKAGDPPRRSGMLPLAIAIGVTASVAALATYMVVGGSSPAKGDAPLAAPAAPVQARQAAQAPPSAPSAEADKLSPLQSTAARPDTTAAAKQPGRAKEVGETSAKTRPSGRSEIAAKAPARVAEGPSSHPAVKISGIVWQEEPSGRKAMINGKVARVGETVDGMKVLEIHPSHVKLSYDGKSFRAGMFE